MHACFLFSANVGISGEPDLLAIRCMPWLTAFQTLNEAKQSTLLLLEQTVVSMFIIFKMPLKS